MHLAKPSLIQKKKSSAWKDISKRIWKNVTSALFEKELPSLIDKWQRENCCSSLNTAKTCSLQTPCWSQACGPCFFLLFIFKSVFFPLLLSCLTPFLSHVGGQLFKTDLTSRISVLASKYPSIIRVFQRTEAAVHELFMHLSLKCLVQATQAPGLMRAGITHLSRSNISEELWSSRQKPHSLQKERRMPPVKLSGRKKKKFPFSF